MAFILQGFSIYLNRLITKKTRQISVCGHDYNRNELKFCPECCAKSFKTETYYISFTSGKEIYSIDSFLEATFEGFDIIPSTISRDEDGYPVYYIGKIIAIYNNMYDIVFDNYNASPKLCELAKRFNRYIQLIYIPEHIET